MTAVTSISTLARSSINAVTCTAVIAALNLPMISLNAKPISRPTAMYSHLSVTYKVVRRMSSGLAQTAHRVA